jgi:WD40 repeat protein
MKTGIKIGLLVVDLLIILGVAWLVWRQPDKSPQARADAIQTMVAAEVRMSPLARDATDPEAYRLAAQALLAMDDSGTGLVRSALLAAESLRRFPTLEGDQALRRAVALLLRPVAEMAIGGWVRVLAFSPTQPSWVVAESEKGIVPVWEADTGREVVRVAHEQGGVLAVAFSPDGKWLATGGSDQTARVWEIDTGREVTRLIHEYPVDAVAFSPDGRWLATKTSDRIFWVWEVATGRKMVRIVHEGRGVMQSVAFSPDGQWLVSGSRGFATGEARIWKVDGWQEIARMAGDVSAVAFSSDGKWLATGSWGVVVREMPSGHKVSQTSPTPSGDIAAMVFSPDGKLLATASGDGVQIWDTRNGGWIANLTHQDKVNSIAFSPDGHWLATASDDHTVRLWKVSRWGWSIEREEVARLEHGGEVKTVAFSSDGRWLATGSTDGKMRIWEVPVVQPEPEPSSRLVTAVAFSPDGRWLVVGTRDSVSCNGPCAAMSQIHKVSDWQEGTDIRRTLAGSFGWPGGAYAVNFSGDSRWLAAAVADQDHTARVWKVDTLQEVGQSAQDVRVVAINADGRWLATATEGNSSVQVWEVATGQEIVQVDRIGLVLAMSFSPDGQWLAVARRGKGGKQVWILEATTGREITRLEYEGWVESMAFSPDGRWLAAGSGTSTYSQEGSGAVWIWETATWRQTAWMNHGEPIETMAFSPGGRWLATQSSHGSVRVWEVSTGREVTRVIQPGVRAVTFSPDGRLLVTSDGPSVRGWLWRPEDLIADACARLPRNLTQEEWRQYFGTEPYCPTCPNLPVPQE